MNIFVLIISTIALSWALASLFTTINEENEQNNTEPTSFECGFFNINDNNIIFSTSFIIMVILFIIFDIEVSIIIPIIFKSNISTNWVSTPLAFFIALGVVLLKEWNIGTLEWNN